MDNPAKPEEKCIYCEQGILTKSPSGDHLICRNCGRIVVLDKVRLPRGPGTRVGTRAMKLHRA